MPITVAPSVDFKRDLYPTDDPKHRGPSVGDDVKAVKIAVSRLGFWHWGEFDNELNDRFAHGHGPTLGPTSGLAGFQRHVGLTPDGVYGAKTHAKLLAARVPAGLPHGGEWGWDGHALALYGHANVPSHAEQVVNAIFDWWDWQIENNAAEHYEMYRPMKELAAHHIPPHLPLWEDCSSTFIYCAFLAGALSPDLTYGYSGLVNTGSLVRCGIPIAEADLAKYQADHYVGAFYGSSVWNTEHISAVRSVDRVYSMGNENAPEVWPTYRVSHLNFLELRAFQVV